MVVSVALVFPGWVEVGLCASVVVLTGDLVLRGTGLAVVLVIMMGTVLVRSWGLGVVLSGTGRGGGGGSVAGS